MSVIKRIKDFIYELENNVEASYFIYYNRLYYIIYIKYYIIRKELESELKIFHPLQKIHINLKEEKLLIFS